MRLRSQEDWLAQSNSPRQLAYAIGQEFRALSSSLGRADEFGVSPGESASVNAIGLQAALNRGGLVKVTHPGTYIAGDTLIIPSNGGLYLGPGVTLKLADGVNKLLIGTASYASRATTYAVTSITSSGNVATVTRTAHGRAVGDYVSLSGSTTSGYNGTFRIITVPTANTYTVILEMVPGNATAAGTIVERTATHDIWIGGEGFFDGNRDNRTGTNTANDFLIFPEFCANVMLDVKCVNAIHRAVASSCVNGMYGKAEGWNCLGGFISGGCLANVDMHRVAFWDCDDDLSALQSDDYSGYAGTQGDLIKCRIRCLEGTTDINGMKIITPNGFTATDIHIDYVSVDSGGNCISVLNDSITTNPGTDVRMLTIGHLNHINPRHGKAGVGMSRDTGTPVLHNLVIKSANVRVATGVSYWLVYPDNTNCTIEHAAINNWDIRGADTNQDVKVFKQVGQIAEAVITNGRLENGGNIYDHDSAGSAYSGQNVFISNVLQKNTSVGVTSRRAINVHNLGGWVFDTAIGTAVFSSASGAAVNFYGDLPQVPAGYERLFNLPTTPGFKQTVGDVTCTFAAVTAAQVKALNATPITLVAAPGAGFALEFVNAEIFMDYGAAAYAGIAAGEDLAIRYTDGSGTICGAVEATGFLDQTTDQLRTVTPGSAVATGIAEQTPTANAALVLHMLTGEITTGDSPLYLKVWTRTRNTGRAFG